MFNFFTDDINSNFNKTSTLKLLEIKKNANTNEQKNHQVVLRESKCLFPFDKSSLRQAQCIAAHRRTSQCIASLCASHHK